MEKLFTIEHPLLVSAICGRTSCNEITPLDTGGYLYYEEKPIGRAFLEYCYSVIFGIHRFPGYQNYYDRCNYACSWLVEAGELSESDIVSACRELKDLYRFSTEYLMAQGKQDLELYRTLNTTEVQTARLIESPDGNRIAFQTNIMSSYTRTSDLNYAGKVKIKRTVKASDILMIDELTAYPTEQDRPCPYRTIISEYEVWVKCEDRFGEVIIPVENITEGRDILLASADTRKSLRQKDLSVGDGALADSYLSEHRPCELTRISKWLTKRNKKRLERLIR